VANFHQALVICSPVTAVVPTTVASNNVCVFRCNAHSLNKHAINHCCVVAGQTGASSTAVAVVVASAA
jgi:hypothetical protein